MEGFKKQKKEKKLIQKLNKSKYNQIKPKYA